MKSDIKIFIMKSRQIVHLTVGTVAVFIIKKVILFSGKTSIARKFFKYFLLFWESRELFTAYYVKLKLKELNICTYILPVLEK